MLANYFGGLKCSDVYFNHLCYAASQRKILYFSTLMPRNNSNNADCLLRYDKLIK